MLRFGRKDKVGSTPLVFDEFLQCYLKLESENPSGSHKDRETVYLIEKFGLSEKYLIVSSGTAGISLAYWVGENAMVLVPENTPQSKINAIRELGADVRVKGSFYSDTYLLADEIAEEEGFVNISPGKVERWQGNSSLAREVVDQGFSRIFLPGANLNLAYGVASGIQELLDAGEPIDPVTVVICVLPNHPISPMPVETIDERYQEVFNSIFVQRHEEENIMREVLNFPFTEVKTTQQLDLVNQLSKKYSQYDPASVLPMFIQQNYAGKKAVIVTGISH